MSRTTKAAAAVNKLLKVASERNEIPRTHDFADKAAPRIGVLLAGGGWRGMLSSVGFLDGLADAGLLDCATSVAGVSGASWCVAQTMSAGADFNPFHLSDNNPWRYGGGIDRTVHTYDGLVRMLDADHVAGCVKLDDCVWSTLWTTFVTGAATPRTPNWASVMQGLREQHHTDDATVIQVLLMSEAARSGQPLGAVWAEFVGRQLGGAWNKDTWPTLDIDACKDAIESGAYPNFIMSAVSTDALLASATTTATAPQPANVWAEFTAFGARNYATQTLYGPKGLFYCPISEDSISWESCVNRDLCLPFDNAHAKMGVCGSAFAQDFSECLGDLIGWVTHVSVVGLAYGNLELVRDGTGQYLKGSKCIVASSNAADADIIGRMRDGDHDLTVAYPAMLSRSNGASNTARNAATDETAAVPEDLSDAAAELRSLLYTAGREHDVLLVHDAGNDETGAASLERALGHEYYQLCDSQSADAEAALNDIASADPTKTDAEADMRQIGQFRVFYPREGTALPIIVYQLGVCCESTMQVVFKAEQVRKYATTVRERTACAADSDQSRAFHAATGVPFLAVDGRTYYQTVLSILQHLSEKGRGDRSAPAARLGHKRHFVTMDELVHGAVAVDDDGADKTPCPAQPPSRGNDDDDDLDNKVDVAGVANTLRMKLAAKHEAMNSHTVHLHDSEFCRALLHDLFVELGYVDEDGQHRAFVRLAGMVYRHAKTVIHHARREEYTGDPCIMAADDPLRRLDFVLCISASLDHHHRHHHHRCGGAGLTRRAVRDVDVDDKKKSGAWIPYEFRVGKTEGLYSFLLSYVAVRSQLLRDREGGATGDLIFRRKQSALRGAFFPVSPDHAAASEGKLRIPVVDKVLREPVYKLGSLTDFPLEMFPKFAAFMADMAASIHYAASASLGLNPAMEVAPASPYRLANITDTDNNHDAAATPMAAVEMDDHWRGGIDLVAEIILPFFSNVLEVSMEAADVANLHSYSLRDRAASQGTMQTIVDAVALFQHEWAGRYLRDHPEVAAKLQDDAEAMIIQLPDHKSLNCHFAGAATVFRAFDRAIKYIQRSSSVSPEAVLMLLESVMRSDNIPLFDFIADRILTRAESQRNAIAAARSWRFRSANMHDLIGSGNYHSVERYIIHRRAAIVAETGGAVGAAASPKQLSQRADKVEQLLNDIRDALSRAVAHDSPRMAEMLIEQMGAASERRRARADVAQAALACAKWRVPAWRPFLQLAPVDLVINSTATAVALLRFARGMRGLAAIKFRVDLSHAMEGDEDSWQTVLLDTLTSGKHSRLRVVDFGELGFNSEELLTWLRSGGSDAVETLHVSDSAVSVDTQDAIVAELTTSQALVVRAARDDGSVEVTKRCGALSPQMKRRATVRALYKAEAGI